MVSKRGIDANPPKVQAALDIPEPKTKRDVQRLTGRMAALSKIISKALDKGLPLFKALKLLKSKELIWGDEQKQAFQQLTSNNEAEYEAAITGLELCIALEAEHVCLKTNSQLIANQIRGEYEPKELSAYLAKIKTVIVKLRTFEIELIPKGQNAQADALSKLAIIHRPSRDLQPILNPLPFAQWGLDILGPFPDAPYQNRWLIVGIDYFSKWIEAEAASNITEQTIRKFIWQNIITRFGIPKVFVFDHGRQFDNLPLKRYIDQFGNKLAYSAVCHPQSNG
ncbi:uncharacterized protein LOC110718070 [Chenopodium quinoa]|uniref:uncharacterized protein LOC110718070 n=1 Tax=Chenopodium quinoa TaxID=63459 RepID=UPI000B76C1F2|nr:uncharacterized protein LOC110718070 [Chenopodium quinoa]